MTSRRKLLIDTDAGVDDAQAILMALSRKDVDVIGITCVGGNADAKQVGMNVLRVLQVAGSMHIPVFVGSDESLMGDKKETNDYHGTDGFGDAPDPNAPDVSHLRTEHAVNCLVRMSKEHQGDLTLVCIGPLTNIALAIRMDPQIGSRLRHCYIMGGNYLGKGNATVSAEFNFYCDPEAAYVVLNQLGAPITLMPWEVCETHTLTWECHNTFAGIDSRAASFISRLEKNVMKNFYQSFFDKGIDKGYELADQFAMAAAVADDVITDRKHVFATVELKSLCRGQMVVDWNNVLGKKANINLVTTMSKEKLIKLLLFAFNCFGSHS